MRYAILIYNIKKWALLTPILNHQIILIYSCQFIAKVTNKRTPTPVPPGR